MFKIETGGPTTALLLLVPIRLGSDSLNVIYIPCIKVGVFAMMSLCVSHDHSGTAGDGLLYWDNWWSSKAFGILCWLSRQ